MFIYLCCPIFAKRMKDKKEERNEKKKEGRRKDFKISIRVSGNWHLALGTGR